jgi:hypothetical protein
LLNEYHEPHLTVAQSTAIFTDLANLKKYVSANKKIGQSLLGDCGTSAKVDQFKKLDEQLMAQKVNGSFTVLRSPNLLHWASLKAASDYQNDETLVCGVAFPYPFEVTSDYVLWRKTCSTGVLATDSQGHLDREFKECIQMEEAIDLKYGLVE